MATVTENLLALEQAKQDIKTAIENKGQDLSDTPFTQYAEKIEAIQSGGGTDMLQARIDKTGCKNLFYGYPGTDIDFAKNMDTSNCEDMTYMFRSATELTRIVPLNTSNVKTMESMFSHCYALTSLPPLDTSAVENMKTMFYGCKGFTSIDLSIYDTSNVTAINQLLYQCENLTDVVMFDTSKIENMGSLFNGCKKLHTISNLDLLSATTTGSVSAMFMSCLQLTNLSIKNIRVSLQLSNDTTYGQLLTVDSLVNTIRELWENNVSGKCTLTIGAINLEKLSSIYVKLIDITPEMLAEDEYIENKVPFELCDASDENAMSIIDYAHNIKWWDIV